jgi:hypothetical protein
MNRSVLLVSFALVMAFCSSALAQASPAPPGAGDRNIGNTSIKDRSNELERVDREMHKSESNKPNAAPPAQVNFQQIKEDFEAIQKLQDDIINAYSKGSTIDYARISSDAGQLNQSATRLESNLFPPPPEKKKDNKKTAEQAVAVSQPDQPLPTDVKSLIVDQDSHMGQFVSNPIFTNPQVVDPANNVKAHADLGMLIKVSAALKQASDKLKK